VIRFAIGIAAGIAATVIIAEAVVVLQIYRRLGV